MNINNEKLIISVIKLRVAFFGGHGMLQEKTCQRQRATVRLHGPNMTATFASDATYGMAIPLDGLDNKRTPGSFPKFQ